MVTGVTALCSALATATDHPGGVYPGPSGAAFVEDWTSGSLVLCGGGSAKAIATAPTGFADDGYISMAGVKTTTGLDLLLLSWAVPGGWVCVGATSAGCSSHDTFRLPSAFCSAEPKGNCDPTGVIVASSLAFTYVDPSNAQMVTCKSLASSCTVDAASSTFAALAPGSITKLGTTIYVGSSGCSGDIWRGTTTSVTLMTSIGDEIGGMAFSKANPAAANHLYVGDNGVCTGVAHVVDVTDGKSLPTPFTSSEFFDGVDSKLQFSWFGGTSNPVYKTTDSS